MGNPNFGGGKVGAGFLRNTRQDNGHVEVPSSPSLMLTESLTVEGWVKMNPNSAGGFVLQRSFDPFHRSYDVAASDHISFIVHYNITNAMIVFSDPIPPGQFVHFAAVLDVNAGKISMYINGNLVRQFNATERPRSAPAITRIAELDGIADEVSVYNRALSASEILAIYNAGNSSTGAAGKCLEAQRLPRLLLEQAGPTTNQLVALDAVLFIRDPFPIVNPANLFNLASSDRNTRLLIFVADLQLAPNEPPSAVVVNLVDSNNQTHQIAAENVWSGVNSDFSQVTFRLPDALPPGTCTVTVKLHGQTSNAGTIRIQN